MQKKGSCSTWTGVDERQDALDAIAFAWTLPNVTHVLVCAYSFGAAVTCGVLDQCVKPPSAVCVIGYPKGLWAWFLFSAHYSGIRSLGKIPKLLVQGEGDNFTSSSTLKAIYEDLEDPKEMHIIPDADHFFFHHEDNLVNCVVEWWMRVKL